MSEPAVPVVYQLRVVLREISPLIWRRLLVRGDSSIADLHHTLQIAVGWGDTHLHRFIIHGKDYGVARPGGHTFADAPTQIRLADFGFRPGERFAYQYDFGDDWQHDLRVERIVSVEPHRTYPVCVGGARAAPPEGCGGSWAYLEIRQHHSVFAVTQRLEEILDAGTVGDDQEEIRELLRWLVVDRFDRRRVNRRLRQYAAGDDRWRSDA